MRRLTRGTAAALAVVMALAAHVTGAQSPASRRSSFDVFGRENLRLFGGQTAPIAGARDWNAGHTLGIGYETWGTGGGNPYGAIDVGAGFSADYSTLPLDEARFLADFTLPGSKHATAAQSSSATLWDLKFNLRIRGPLWPLVPSVVVSTGYYTMRFDDVAFQSPDTNGTAHFQGKSGALAGIGASLDSPPVKRVGVYVETMYTYGWANMSSYQIVASSRCQGNSCDAFSNTSTWTARGGVRVRVGRR